MSGSHGEFLIDGNMTSVEYADQLEKLQVPTLVIAGEDDPVTLGIEKDMQRPHSRIVAGDPARNETLHVHRPDPALQRNSRGLSPLIIPGRFRGHSPSGRTDHHRWGCAGASRTTRWWWQSIAARRRASRPPTIRSIASTARGSRRAGGSRTARRHERGEQAQSSTIVPECPEAIVSNAFK